MTEAADFKIEFLDEFFDEIFNSDFFDEVVNIALNCEVASGDESSKITKPVQNGVCIAKSIKCHKRKLSDAELGNGTKQHIRSNSPDSPNIDVLRRAVERINANKSDGEETTSSGIVVGSFNEFTVPIDTETRQQPERIPLNSPSQIDDQPNLQRIVNDILKGFKVMIIMRGAPGCGKSFLAREIINKTTKDCWSDHIFSSCDFFYNRDGCFHFNRNHLRESHQWNIARMKSHVCSGWSPIIIDNTNIKKWEMTDYLKVAVQYGYLVEIIQPNTPWSKSVDELVTMNIHDVPKETIERMILTFESTTVDELMAINGLKYSMELPQYRRLPTLL